MAAFSVTRPRTTCTDRECPFHGTLSLRGRLEQGLVVRAKMDRTVVVQRDYLAYVPKLKRYERRRSRIPVHNPPCINAKEGDIVKIVECRPISKTVSFVVIEKSEAQ